LRYLNLGAPHEEFLSIIVTYLSSISYKPRLARASLRLDKRLAILTLKPYSPIPTAALVIATYRRERATVYPVIPTIWIKSTFICRLIFFRGRCLFRTKWFTRYEEEHTHSCPFGEPATTPEELVKNNNLNAQLLLVYFDILAEGTLRRTWCSLSQSTKGGIQYT
jgi:hypothetical protein